MFDKKKENTSTIIHRFLPTLSQNKQSLINRYSTLSPHSNKKKESSIQLQILSRKKKYTEDQTQNIRKLTQGPVLYFHQKYHKPHGAAKSQRLKMILQRKKAEKINHRLSSIVEVQNEKKKRYNKKYISQNTIEACSLQEAILYG